MFDHREYGCTRCEINGQRDQSHQKSFCVSSYFHLLFLKSSAVLAIQTLYSVNAFSARKKRAKEPIATGDV